MHIHAPSLGPDDVWAAIDANVTLDMWGFTNQNSVVDQVTIQALNGSSIASVYTPAGAKWAGAQGTTNQTIPQAAAIIKLVTLTRGRSYRGRLYIPWVCENMQSGGALDASTVADCQANWQDFVADLIDASMELCVASYKLSIQTTVVSTICEPWTGTQRHRAPTRS